MSEQNNSTPKRGGARPNSGRKKEPWLQKRIPLIVIEKLKQTEFTDPVLINWIAKL